MGSELHLKLNALAHAPDQSGSGDPLLPFTIHPLPFSSLLSEDESNRIAADEADRGLPYSIGAQTHLSANRASGRELQTFETFI